MQDWRDVALPDGYEALLKSKDRAWLIRHAMAKELNHRKANAYLAELYNRLKIKAAAYAKMFAGEYEFLALSENDKDRISNAIDIIQSTLGDSKSAAGQRWAMREACLLIKILDEHAECMKKLSRGIDEIMHVLHTSKVPERDI
mgnify:CR=1 FL=1